MRKKSERTIILNASLTGPSYSPTFLDAPGRHFLRRVRIINMANFEDLNVVPSPKITANYLHHMEEKIFHVRLPKEERDEEPAAKRFPQELLQQLSQHKKFRDNSSQCYKEVLVDLMEPKNLATSSATLATSSATLATSTATQKKRAKERKSRQVLFNPYYEDQRRAGLGLLETIRTKIFSFALGPLKASSASLQNGSCANDDDEDAWKCSDEAWKRSEDALVAESRLKFPKETRHAYNNQNNSSRSLERTTQVCALCCRRMRKVTDAQTGTSSKEKLCGSLRVPCPLNILCERGIHVGECDESVRKKVKEDRRVNEDVKLCKSCLRRKGNMQLFKKNGKGFRKYPGRAMDIRPLALCKDMLRTKVESREVQCCNDDEEVLQKPLESSEKEPPILEVKMNGLNGHTNGELNGCGDIITQNQQKGCWTIGLINSKYRYLTAETFGFKINANGVSLKKKQIWTLEPEGASSGESLIYLRSHLGKYLAVDSFGNVTCESDDKDGGCQFQISVSEDGSGRWALKNVIRGYFLGSTQDKLACTAKVPGDAELWHVHLAARPQMNLRSVGRKRFAHLSENLDEIHVDANIPWGEDTLFTLEFRLDESGKYAIHTCNNKYLHMGGKLVDACTKDCLFSAEYHGGQLALRDHTGAYLSPIGSKAVLKTRSNTVTKDELFSLEDSLPQASFVASLNCRYVSVKQGVDVTANQDEISDHETFQLEFDWSTKRWYIRTMQDRYWTLETGGGIQACGDKRSSNALFDLVWQKEGSLAFRANNGRYVITKRSGHLYATADAIDDNCKYFFYLINRPILVLKCEQGFVGYKSAGAAKLECNKATYECIQVERGEKGVVHFKGQNGKYWHADAEGIACDSDTRDGFYLELREPTRLCIKSVNGNYLTANKNGLFRLGDAAIENATHWEY